MEIIPLGTNGFFSSFNRQTACYALPFRKVLLLLDAGSGLFRLAEEKGKKLLTGREEVHLFLSHFHLDHTFGFYAAFKIFQRKKVKVFLSEKKEVFRELPKLKYFPVDFPKVYQNFTWEALKPGKNVFPGYEVWVRKQFHRGEGSLAFRFRFFKEEKELAYITDSEPNQELISFVSGVSCLLCEGEPVPWVWAKKNFTEQLFDGHLTFFGAAEIAKVAKVGRLFFIHHHPFFPPTRLKKQLKMARKIFPVSFLAEDLVSIKF